MVTSCAACHVPVHPQAIPMSAWNSAIPRMVLEAKLKPTDERDIRAYVMAVRAAAPQATE
jgi:Dihaem cytochrome c